MKKKRRSREFKNSSKVIDMEQARTERIEKRREMREEEELKQAQSVERRNKRMRALKKKQSRRRLFTAAVALALIVLMVFSMVGIIKLKTKEHEMLKEQEQLKQEKIEKEKELKDSNETDNIEDEARSKLKLIKPGETVYIPEDESHYE
ncbi:MAG: septum formation initiator family protein [Bacillota bacterium]|nr:septum formation initiator family protein [Bacillota bacterium]